MTTLLEAKVAAVNKVNAYANKLFPLLSPVFAPYVGQQITTQTGEILAKIAKKMPAIPDCDGIRVVRSHSEYSLGWSVTAMAPYGNDTCTYHEITVYIGWISKGVLTGMSEPANCRTDFTAAEILELREKATIAKKAYDDVVSALHPFGESDRR